MNLQLRDWLNNYCNCRIHGTTKEKPILLFSSHEASALISLPQEDFMLREIYLRKVHSDCHITVDNNYYSVPAAYVGHNVEIALSDNLVKIYEHNEQIALHTKRSGES
jgi:hypothetical protein